MLLKNLDRFKVSTTDQAVTSYAGLVLPLGMGRSLGLEKELNSLPLKERNRGYQPAEVGFTLVGLIQAGGEALDDVKHLAGDAGLRELLGTIPAANTLGQWLMRFTGALVCRLGWIQLKLAVKVIRVCKLKRVTLDVDAFFVDSQKDGVLMNYEGRYGYCPVMVTCSELGMPMAGLFRKGNASPMANLAALLERVIEALQKEIPGIEIRLRSDSAGYQAKVIRVCEKAGVGFTITARQDDSVKATIREIPKKEWVKLESEAWPGRETEVAESLQVMGDKDTAAHRLLVLRWKKEERDLWDKDPYQYHAVLDGLERWTAGLTLQFHRSRQAGSEHVNEAIKGGFGMAKLPCGDFMANAAYFQFALLSATVFCAWKHLTLPESWSPVTIQTVRFRMIHLAGIVSQRARSLYLKIPASYPLKGLFEEVRWRVLGLAAETG